MKILEEDTIRVVNRFKDVSFVGKTVLVTGGTGLIGKTLVPVLHHLGAKVVLLVRSEEKARKLYCDSCTYYVGVAESIPTIEEDIDFIIHMASPTSSEFFLTNPVETLNIAVQGTKNFLDVARAKNVSDFIYLSSMEVYGSSEKGHLIKEEEVSGFDTRVCRNSYPLSKLACEMLCSAYAHEYNVPAKVVRLTQVFGAGVEYQERRIFGELMRCAIERKSIVLHTKGETERCYLYTADAVDAIITVLLYGEYGEVYNAANPDTYCSIREMAELVAGIGNVDVRYQIDGDEYGYANTIYSKLDCSKLIGLGWTPKFGLKEMFVRMIDAQSN